MKQQLLNEICQILKEKEFKALFGIYIDMGLQTDPEELLLELYGQIIGDPENDYKRPNELLGNNTVKLIRKYFEN